MSKTEKTIEMERAIYKATNKMGVFGCFEVTIGWYGKERVDYLTYDTKGLWSHSCIELICPLKTKSASCMLGLGMDDIHCPN